MRELKFRVWSDTNGRMFYNVPAGRSEYEDYAVPYDIKTIMQYTGLKDATGKEVFDGDFIVNIDNENLKYLVRYDSDSNRYMAYADNGSVFYFGPSRMQKHKVIGNLYENPELIEK